MPIYIMNSDNTRVHGERGGKISPLNYMMILPVLYFVFDLLHSDTWWCLQTLRLTHFSRTFLIFWDRKDSLWNLRDLSI